MTPEVRKILDLLQAKHHEDVFVSECKTGSSSGNYHQIDGWAMTKSWAHPLVTAYEIKTSRQDFLHDNKWQAYLPYCNELYFVTNKTGIVKPDELPETIGLYIMASTETMLRRIKVAIRREVTVPESLYRYILMWRVKIRSEFEILRHGESNARYWNEWLQNKNERKIIGSRCSYRLKQLYAENVDKVRQENDRLERRIEEYEKIKKLCDDLGLSQNDYRLGKNFKEAVNSVIPSELVDQLRWLQHQLVDVLKEIDKIEKKGQQNESYQ